MIPTTSGFRPKCEGEVLRLVEAGVLSFAEAWAISPADLADRGGLPTLWVTRSLLSFSSFALVAFDAFATEGCVPAQICERARFAALGAA